MNNGNGHPPGPSQGQNSMALVPPGMIVTPEDYRLNMQRLQAMRDYVANYERRNNEGFHRFLAEEHALRERVQNGREAERLLAQLEAARAELPQTLDSVNHSSIAHPQPPLPQPTYLHNSGVSQAAPQYTYQESARIVELPSPGSTSPDLSRQQSSQSVFVSNHSIYGQQRPYYGQQQPYYGQQGVGSSSQPMYQQSRPVQTSQTSQSSSLTQPTNAYPPQASTTSSAAQYGTFPQIDRTRSDNASSSNSEQSIWPVQPQPATTRPSVNAASTALPEDQNPTQSSAAPPVAASSSAPNVTAAFTPDSQERRAAHVLEEIVRTFRGLRPMTIQYIIMMTVHWLGDNSLYKGPLDMSIAEKYTPEEQKNLQSISRRMVELLKNFDRNMIIRILMTTKQMLHPGPWRVPSAQSSGAPRAQSQPIAGPSGSVPASTSGNVVPPSSATVSTAQTAPQSSTVALTATAAAAQSTMTSQDPSNAIVVIKPTALQPTPILLTPAPPPPLLPPPLPSILSEPALSQPALAPPTQSSLSVPIPRRSTEVPTASNSRRASNGLSPTVDAERAPAADAAQPSASKPFVALPRYMRAAQLPRNAWHPNVPSQLSTMPPRPDPTVLQLSSRPPPESPAAQNGLARISGQDTIAIPEAERSSPHARTPEQPSRPHSPWTPAKANKTRLAQDLLRSLGRPHAASPTQLPSQPQPQAQAQSESQVQPQQQLQPAQPSEELGSQLEAGKRRRMSESFEMVKRPRMEPELAENTSVDEIVTPGVIEQELEALRQREQDVENVDAPSSSTIPAESVAIEAQAYTPLADIPSIMSVAPGPSLLQVASPGLNTKYQESTEQRQLSPEAVSQPFAIHEVIEIKDSEDEAPMPARKSANIPSQQAGSSQNLPLFLPSPSSASQSPVEEVKYAHTEGSDSDTPPKSPSRRKGKGKARATDSVISTPTRTRVYVLVPPSPTYVRQWKQRQAERGRHRRRRPIPQVETESEIDELGGYDVGLEGRTEDEQAAADLSWTRLRSMPCKWLGCEATLNSAHRLRWHLEMHAELVGDHKCWWDSCGLHFPSSPEELLPHVSKHALSPVFCAYEACDRQFPTAGQLLAHHESPQHRNQSLRGTPMPFVHVAEEGEVPFMPETLPSWMNVPLRVSKHPIPHEVHHWLGPRILANISFFHCPGYRTQVSTPSRGSRRIAEKLAAAERETNDPLAALELMRRMTHDEYELIIRDKPWPRSKRFGDLPSVEVTQMVEEGLVLWPCDGDADEEFVDAEGEQLQEAQAGPSRPPIPGPSGAPEPGPSQPNPSQSIEIDAQEAAKPESRNLVIPPPPVREGGTETPGAIAAEAVLVEPKNPSLPVAIPASVPTVPLVEDGDVPMLDVPQDRDEQLSQPGWKTLSEEKDESENTVENILSPHLENMSVSFG